jgi:hypothetical protein
MSPLASVKVVCDSDERRLVREVVDATNKFKSPDFQMLEHFVSSNRTPISNVSNKRKLPTRSSSTSSNKKTCKSTDKDVPVPAPASGKYYEVSEFLQVLNNTKENSSERGRLVSAILEMKYVPIGKTALYRMLRELKEGLPVPSEWRVHGRPALADKTAIDDIAQKLEGSLGMTFGKKEVSKLLVEHQKQKIEETGYVPLNVPETINRQSLNNYIARLALHPNLSVATKTIRKSDTRQIAENNFRPAFNLALSVATSHFIEVPHEDPTVARDMKTLPKETRLLYDLVTSAVRGPVVPVKPALLFSTDDSTQYVFEGRVDKPDKFRLVSKKSCEQRGTRALYSLNKGNDMRGFRVKVSISMNAIGAHSPLFVSISGLSDREMPFDGNVFVVKVPGLCVGGGVGSNSEVGYIMFCKKGSDQERYEYYHKHVLIPMIERYRKELYDYDSQLGMPCPDEYTAEQGLRREAKPSKKWYRASR